MLKNIFSLFGNRRGEGPDATPKPKLSIKERFAALKNLPAFLKIIWRTSPSMALGNMLLRLLRSVIPLSLLYIGKLIIDDLSENAHRVRRNLLIFSCVAIFTN